MTAQGFVAPGFERVADAFESNFAERAELGASFAAVLDDRLVVDLWGGTADAASGRPWAEDTLQLVFSGTKGLVAVCLLLLIERAALELDVPVARYWPEYARAGKEATLVRHVVSHLAGVPGLRAPVTAEDILDDRRMAELLAGQEPFWPPGSALCYHALTYGWLCGELVRRVDGRSVGRFFADEVAAPLGLEAWIGLPTELEPRVATLRRRPGEPPAYSEEELAAHPVRNAILGNPNLLLGEPTWWNTRECRAAEIPGANAVAASRSLARLYGCLARGGELDGIRLLGAETVRLGRTCLAAGVDAVDEAPRAFGVGFALPSGDGRYGPAPVAFGHGGAGGSVHGAWPEQRVGFSYSMNEMRNEERPERPAALLGALYDAVVAAGT